MNMSKKGLILLVMIGILPHIAAATPGIIVTVDPLSKDTQYGTTVDYLVTITNEDGFSDKIITSIEMEVTQPGWIYVIEPLATTTLPASGSLTTTLHVTVPSDAIIGNYYSHRINATAVIESIPYYVDIDPEDFDTHIIESTIPIPEFPTIALPVISVLGIMFLMSRRKRTD